MRPIDADKLIEIAIKEAEAMTDEVGKEFINVARLLALMTPTIELQGRIERADIAFGTWVSCEEALPAKEGDYIVTRPFIDDELFVMEARYWPGKLSPGFYRVDDEGAKEIYEDVLAWMPLPEPYQRKEQES